LEGITPSDLGKGPLSILRNPDIVHVLYLRRLMENVGRGSIMICKSFKERGLPAPEWRSDNNGVTLIFYATEVTMEVTTEVTMEVTTEVVRVLNNMDGELSGKELKNLLMLKNDEHFRKAYLNPALKAGVIEMTIPEKPNSSKQKYRLTELGRKLQKSYKEI